MADLLGLRHKRLNLHKIFVLALTVCQFQSVCSQDIIALDSYKYNAENSISEDESGDRSTTQQITFDVTNLGSGNGFYDQDKLLLQLHAESIKTFTKVLGNSQTNQHLVAETENGDCLQLLRYISPATGREILVGSLVDLETKLVYQFRQASTNEAEDGKVQITALVTPSEDIRESAEPYQLDEQTQSELDDYREESNWWSFINPLSRFSLSAVDALSSAIKRNDRENSEINTVTLMVVWSRQAECEYSNMTADCKLTDETADNMRAEIAAAVAETNAAYTLSNIDIQHELVHAYRHPSYTESDVVDQLDAGTLFSTLVGLIFPLDGLLDDVQGIRRQYEADMVSMVISDGQYCGVASIGSGFVPVPTASFMFSVLAWDCLAGTYTMAHELGHNFGCSHDRGTNDQCDTHWIHHAHGWRDPANEFRTIMAYGCQAGQCDNNTGLPCPVVPRYSDSSESYKNGSPLGDSRNDCARQLRDVGKRVSQFYGGGSLCFAPHMTVQVEDARGSVEMKDLRAGDRVLTAAKGGAASYQTIYSINHFHRTRPTEFLQLHLEHPDSTAFEPWILELSAHHMVFVKERKNPIPAAHIRAGDSVQALLPSAIQQNKTATSKHREGLTPISHARVTDVQTVFRQGFYNPLTMDGTILVNGVATSAYSSLLALNLRIPKDSIVTLDEENIWVGSWKILSQHGFLHLALSPFRAAFLMRSFGSFPFGIKFGVDRSAEARQDYTSPYCLWGIGLSKWWQRQANSLQTLVFVMLLVGFGLFHLLLSGSNNWFCTLALLLLGFRFLALRTPALPRTRSKLKSQEPNAERQDRTTPNKNNRAMD